MNRYMKLWVILLILALISFGTQNLALSAWDSFVHFTPPEFEAEPGGRAEPLTRQVVLVVVDGLRVDAFNKMKYVSSLKEKGAYFVLKTGQPSLSYPTWATIATGAWQDVTGVTTNWFEGPVRQDSIFSLARDNGMTSYIVGSEGWEKLFGNVATKVYAREWKDSYNTFDEKTLEKALEYLGENPNLLLVHFVDTDEAGHDFGGASPEYQKYADHIDTLIEKLHKSMSEDSVLIVTADHGQIDRGGHGGWEDVVTNVPLVMIGEQIYQGEFEQAEQGDVAPTVSALLGLPMPPYSQGKILVGGFYPDVTYYWLSWAQRYELYVSHSRSFGVEYDMIPMKYETTDDYYEYLYNKYQFGKNCGIVAESIRNLPLFLIVLLLPLTALYYARRRWKLSYKLPFLISLLFFAIYYAIFFASGKTISLSAINEEDLLQQFFNQVMMYAAISLISSAIVLSLLERRKERYEVAKSTVILTALVALLFVIQIDVFFLYNGPFIKWYIPNMFLAFKYYLDMLALVAVGYVSVALPLISMGTHWVCGRLKI